MTARRRSAMPLTRRFLLAATVALAGFLWPRVAVHSMSSARSRIATVRRDEGLVPPLTLGLARVILRPGGWAATETPGGVRILVVESGELVVATAPQTERLVVAAQRPAPTSQTDAAEELVVAAGSAVAFASSRISAIRNRGSRAVVMLDVAVFHGEPRPLARAFTSDEGMSFQLLTSAHTASAPEGRVAITLERVRLNGGATLPADLGRGLALGYVEEGRLECEAVASDVSTARSAASAPYSTPGPLRPLRPGERREVTAGGAIFLQVGAAATAANRIEREAVILMLAVSARQ